MLKRYAAKLLLPYCETASTYTELEAMLEEPPKPEMGDWALPCYSMAKVKRQSPVVIAAALAELLNQQTESTGVIAEAVGGYVNFKFKPSRFSMNILNQSRLVGKHKLTFGQGKRVIIDMSSPNIAKPFGIGHLRSTMIGNALMNLYREAGYDAVSVNHLGDLGTQFGKLIAAYQHWGDDTALHVEPIKESLKLYVQFHEEVSNRPELETEAREWFRKLEQGDEETTRLWKYFVGVSMEEFNRVYARLGVSFDYVLGESFYNDKMQAVVDRLRELELLEESEGAMVVRLDEEGLPPCLILKSDGTTIYPTRDLATAIFRKEVLQGDKLLYVVGAEQQLHFKQVFAVLRKMGYEWADDCIHVPFGLMTLNGKKMSTRRGQVVYLDQVLDEAVQKSLEIIQNSQSQDYDKYETAEAVGVGAIVFGDLVHNRMLTVDFNLDEALRFEGETGAYLQYTFARAMRLLKKAEGKAEQQPHADEELLGEQLHEPETWNCIKLLDNYEETVLKAVRNHEPSILTRLLLDIAKAFNRFYHQKKILDMQGDERAAKLYLVSTTATILKHGLQLLGMKAPHQI